MVWGNNHAGGYFYSTKMLDFITKKWCAILYQTQYICIHNIVQRISLNKRSYKNEETIHFMGELSFGVIIMWVSVLLGCMECVFGQWAISSLLCIALAHYSHMKTIYMCYVSLSLFLSSFFLCIIPLLMARSSFCSLVDLLVQVLSRNFCMKIVAYLSDT